MRFQSRLLRRISLWGDSRERIAMEEKISELTRLLNADNQCDLPWKVKDSLNVLQVYVGDSTQPCVSISTKDIPGARQHPAVRSFVAFDVEPERTSPDPEVRKWIIFTLQTTLTEWVRQNYPDIEFRKSRSGEF
jgi:hypothetical protein